MESKETTIEWVTGTMRFYLLLVAFIILSIMVVSIVTLLTSTEYIVGFSLAYYSGVSMIFLPCTFPMALAIISLVGLSRESSKGIIIALLYGFGVAISMSIIGMTMGGVGQMFGINKGTRIAWAIGGTAAIFFSLSQLGIFNIKMQSFDVGIGKLLTKYSIYFTAFIFGLALGDAGIGCPNPAFFILISYIASVGSIVEGAALGFMHGLGRATPLLFFAILTILGSSGAALKFAKKREALNTFFNFTFLGLGAFFLSIAIFGGWWCFSSLHIAWDNFIAFIGAYAISEQAAPHARLEEVTVGWPLGSWFMSLLIIGTVIGRDYLFKQRNPQPRFITSENLLMLLSAATMAVILGIVFIPLESIWMTRDIDIVIVDAGLAVLGVFIVSYIIANYIMKGKKGVKIGNE